MFNGSLVALATPFLDGRIDWESFEHLIRRHLESGTSGLVPCGTTGETPALTQAEHIEIVRRTVALARGKIPVIAGCGTNSTAKTIELARNMEDAGADALLIVTPYYNKPSQKGLIEHYAALAGQVKKPIIIYNVPSRTGVNILPAGVIELARRYSIIVGIKEASGSLDQASQIVREAPGNFCVLSGDDSLTLPLLAVGARGVISVAANIVPREMAELIGAWDTLDVAKAQRLHLRLFPILRALFVETNPVPVKTALYKMGLIVSPEVRLPLAALSAESDRQLTQALEALGLIKKVSI